MTNNNDKQKIYTETNNITIMNGTYITEGINKIFKKYQESSQVMNRSHNVFDSIEKFYHKFDKISSMRGGSYIPTPKWIKNQKKQ